MQHRTRLRSRTTTPRTAGTVIGLGYGFEQATHARTSPTLYPALG